MSNNMFTKLLLRRLLIKWFSSSDGCFDLIEIVGV